MLDLEVLVEKGTVKRHLGGGISRLVGGLDMERTGHSWAEFEGPWRHPGEKSIVSAWTRSKAQRSTWARERSL